jgi:DNA mismatch repair ATPase MutS
MYQPIKQARHFRILDAECFKLGESILYIKEFCNSLLTDFQGKEFLPDWFPEWLAACPNGAREAFAYVIDNPFWLHHLLRALGRFEVLWNFAARADVVPVEFVNSKTPVLMLRDFGDPAIPTEERIVSSLKLSKNALHSIVTGPNRGGKSSFLRGVLTNVKLAHSFGCAFAGKAQMSYFKWIADGLRLDDKPGKESMFEREVAFASGVLSKTKSSGKGLVLYDELFHSTNPPDAKRTSELFCEKLWKSSNCVSLVSTHIYSLAYSAPPSVKRLCLASWKHGKGKYTFSYTARKGICEVSSVDLLLKQYNLFSMNARLSRAKINAASDQNERIE